MQIKDSVWQGCSGYWQNLFIRENLLPLGHAAWQGFITEGRGMVVCDVPMPAARCANANAESVNWSSDVVEYTVWFISMSDVSAYLQALNLEATLIEHPIDTIQTYDPAQTILLLINANGKADINLPLNLKISPIECYQQAQRRWAEFQLDRSPGGLYEQRL
ncbi:hypothetical protein QUA82_04130 [Microcoleus sp. F8-D3]